MRSDGQVVLDACVLVPLALCDLLLRLAEEPRLYLPRWSGEILDEVHRNQQGVLQWSAERADYWRQQVTLAFPEAIVTGYVHLLEKCRNDPKDRHVLAAAIHARSDIIVTENVRDFPVMALQPHRVKAVRASDFLASLYDRDAGLVIRRIDEMCARRRRSRGEILGILSRTAPAFGIAVAADLGVDLVLPG